MACGKLDGCKKRGYCEFAPYCEKVYHRIREDIAKKQAETHNQPAYIEVEIFKSKGAGRNCTLSD